MFGISREGIIQLIKFKFIELQFASGVCADELMELLNFYFQSTFILYDDKFHVKRMIGIRIGYFVAPLLCGVVRYGDDFLVMFMKSESTSETNVVKSVLELFTKMSEGLTFTNKLQDGDFLQFLI